MNKIYVVYNIGPGFLEVLVSAHPSEKKARDTVKSLTKKAKEKRLESNYWYIAVDFIN